MTFWDSFDPWCQCEYTRIWMQFLSRCSGSRKYGHVCTCWSLDSSSSRLLPLLHLEYVCVCGSWCFFWGVCRSYENLIRAAECRSPPPPASLLVFHNYHEILNVHTARSDSSHPEGERAPGCARPTTATNLHPHSSEPPPSLLLLQSFRVQLCPSCPGWPSDLWCSEKTEAISRAINRFFGNERWRFCNVTGVEARVMRDSLKVSKNNTKMQKSPRQPSYLHINKHLHAASRGEHRSPALVLVADWIISFCFSSRIIIKLSVGFLF